MEPSYHTEWQETCQTRTDSIHILLHFREAVEQCIVGKLEDP